MTFHEFYTQFVNAVYDDDLDSQRYYLSMVEEQRHIPVDYLLHLGAVFIPNNDYIVYYMGAAAKSRDFDLYYEDSCSWIHFVLIPIRNLVGEIVGLTGWDAGNKFKEISTGERGLSMYKVSGKKLFKREKFFLSDVDLLRSAYSKRVIFITDGVFDCVSLSYRGIPTIALLGSTVSQEVLYFLRWYKYIYVVSDNDSAGVSLFRRLKQAVPNTYRIMQSETKDIEEFLRCDSNGQITKRLKGLLENPEPLDITLGGSRRKFNISRLNLGGE